VKSSKTILLALFCSVLGLIFYSRSFFDTQLSMIEANVIMVKDHDVARLSEVIDTKMKINKVPLLLSRLTVSTHPDIKEYLEKQIVNQIDVIEGSSIMQSRGRAVSGDKVLYEYVGHNWSGYKDLVFRTIEADRKGAAEETSSHMERSLVRLERVTDGMRMLTSYHEREVAKKTNQIRFYLHREYCWRSFLSDLLLSIKSAPRKISFANRYWN